MRRQAEDQLGHLHNWSMLVNLHKSMFILNTELLAFFRSFHPRYKTPILSNASFEVRERITETLHIEQELDLKNTTISPSRKSFASRLTAWECSLKIRTSLMTKRGICISAGLGIYVVQFRSTSQVFDEIRQLLEAG